MKKLKSRIKHRLLLLTATLFLEIACMGRIASATLVGDPQTPPDLTEARPVVEVSQDFSQVNLPEGSALERDIIITLSLNTEGRNNLLALGSLVEVQGHVRLVSRVLPSHEPYVADLITIPIEHTSIHANGKTMVAWAGFHFPDPAATIFYSGDYFAQVVATVVAKSITCSEPCPVSRTFLYTDAYVPSVHAQHYNRTSISSIRDYSEATNSNVTATHAVVQENQDWLERIYRILRSLPWVKRGVIANRPKVSLSAGAKK